MKNKKFIVVVERVTVYRVEVEAYDAEEAEEKVDDFDPHDAARWDYVTAYRPDRVAEVNEVPPLRLTKAAKRMMCHIAAHGWETLPSGGFAVTVTGVEDEARKLFGLESISHGRVLVQGERGKAFMDLYRRAAGNH